MFIRIYWIQKKAIVFSIFGIFLISSLFYRSDNENEKSAYLETKNVVLPKLYSDNSFIRCKSVMEGNQIEMLKAKRKARSFKKMNISDYDYIKMTSNCALFLKTRNYIMDSITFEEKIFPIAFTIMVYKNVEQFERLLRAIYRPQNYYCIHVDASSSESVYSAISAIAGCFDNVFMASKRFKIGWGTFSVLEADLGCMRDLLKFRKWKYLINLTGQEFPLKTNYELVKILKAYNGANDIRYDQENNIDHEGHWDLMIERITHYRDDSGKTYEKKLRDPPHGLKPVKSSLHIVVTRKFLHFALSNKVALDYLMWVKHTGFPDENFFGTLYYNPSSGAPGAFNGTFDGRLSDMFFMSRLKVWGDENAPEHIYPCGSPFRRNICIFGIADLPLLYNAPQMFANKIDLDSSPLAYDCLEEWHFNKTRLYKTKQFDVTFYENLPFVKSQI